MGEKIKVTLYRAPSDVLLDKNVFSGHLSKGLMLSRIGESHSSMDSILSVLIAQARNGDLKAIKMVYDLTDTSKLNSINLVRDI